VRWAELGSRLGDKLRRGIWTLVPKPKMGVFCVRIVT
jgi:hypothetical protein